MRGFGLASILFVVILAEPAAAAPVVEVEIAQDRVDAVLGETALLDVSLENVSNRSTGPLLGHLVVVDPGADGSADAEDWTDAITLQIPGLGAGESAVVSWDVTPISAGTFFVMVVVVPQDPALWPGVSSNTVFDVAKSAESLQAAVLPVAIAGPLAVGGVLGALSWRERRRVAHFSSV